MLRGINHGQNMGEDVLYSGTVAAAMEGLALGIPSIAFSFAGGDLRADVTRLRDLVPVVTSLLRHVTALTTIPQDTLLNINLPPMTASEIKGPKLTRLGRRVFSNSLQKMKDPWGREVFWIGGGEITWEGEADSDFYAIREGHISVTPLHLDLTHHTLLGDPERWWRAP